MRNNISQTEKWIITTEQTKEMKFIKINMDKSQKQKDEWNSNMLKYRLYDSICRSYEMHKIMLYVDVAINIFSKFTWFTWLWHCLENKCRGNGMENEGKGKCFTVL